MAAVALAIGSGGALSSIETTVLMSVEETIEALGKAGQIRYRAPARKQPTSRLVPARPPGAANADTVWGSRGGSFPRSFALSSDRNGGAPESTPPAIPSDSPERGPDGTRTERTNREEPVALP
jgi:hypothetical protein